MNKITDRKARSIKPGDKPFPAGVTGLTLQSTQTPGKGKWNLRYKSPVTGKRRDMGLGSFPDTPVADALEVATKAREVIAAGGDPIEKRQAKISMPTFEQAARARWEQIAPTFRNLKHRQDWISSLERHVFDTIGSVKVDKLTPQLFANALAVVWNATPETGGRVKQRCSEVMEACWAKGLIQSNPLAIVDRLLPKPQMVERHQPAMPWQQVPEFVQKRLSDHPRMGSKAALLFLILTATRSGEVRNMTWREVDLDNRLWTIPAERMKANKIHRVPLSAEAVTLLEEQRDNAGHCLAGAKVFLSLNKGVTLSDMALTQLLRGAKAPSDVVGRVATAHGFRSSFRNWCADHDYPNDIAERALAHQIANKVQAAYERTDRLEARIDMMQRWANYVTSGVPDKPSSGAHLVVRGQD